MQIFPVNPTHTQMAKDLLELSFSEDSEIQSVALNCEKIEINIDLLTEQMTLSVHDANN